MPDDSHGPPSLVDLIGRSWDLPGAVGEAVFNRHGSTVAFLGGGTLALAPVADPERAETRIRVAVDSGRQSIMPRRKPVPPAPQVRDVLGPIAPYGDRSFLAASARTGGLVSITPRGQVVPLALDLGGPVAAMAAHPTASDVAVAVGGTVHLLTEAEPGAAARFDAEAPVTALAYAPDGRTLAVGREGAVALRAGGDWAGGVAFDGVPEHLSFSPDGRLMACGLREPGFVVVRLADLTGETVADYPTPVRSFAWSVAAGALATSGAFRTVAWALDEDGLGEGLSVGRNGLVIVERVAASPDRPLVAVGYASGLLCVAKVGESDEMMLRPDGGAITALAWAADGTHLAVGDALGTCCLLAFPAGVFK